MLIDPEPLARSAARERSTVRTRVAVVILHSLGIATALAGCQATSRPLGVRFPARWARSESRSDAGQPLPTPLRLADVMSIARENRAEVIAARARARAAAFKAPQVSALDDPMIVGSIDHLPFSFMGVDASVMIEQSFPLSRVRHHRARAADAAAQGLVARAGKVELDVELEAAAALLMVHQERSLQEVVRRQRELADQLVSAASARYAANQGNQAEVLRAETERARLAAQEQSLVAEVASAEAMLRASLGRHPDETIPSLAIGVDLDDAPDLQGALADAARRRPELAAMRAEIDRADADLDVMRSMYWPMARVGAGWAYTMEEGEGAMVLVGLSIPIWRGKLSAGVSEARSMQRMASAELEAMRRMIEGEVGAAHAGVQAALSRVRTLQEDVVPRAQQAVDASLASYGAATVPLVSVIDAMRALWEVEGELVRERAMLELARARLRRAIGSEEEQP